MAIGTGTRKVHVAGQIALDADGGPVAPGDLAGQTAQALRGTRLGLAAAGASFADVVRLTFYVVDWSQERIGDFLADVRSVTNEFGLPSPIPPASPSGSPTCSSPTSSSSRGHRRPRPMSAPLPSSGSVRVVTG